MKKIITATMLFSFGVLFSQQNVVKTDYLKVIEEGKIKTLEDNQ